MNVHTVVDYIVGLEAFSHSSLIFTRIDPAPVAAVHRAAVTGKVLLKHTVKRGM